MAIVDIGSNSVRLVAYEALTRAPTTIFNEKVLCGLGRGVATTGHAAGRRRRARARGAQRFRALCDIMGIPTCARSPPPRCATPPTARSSWTRRKQAIGAPIRLLRAPRRRGSPRQGVASSIYRPDGVVGDLGGGSLELTDIRAARLGDGVTLPLGGLSLMDVSDRSPKKAARIARDTLARAAALAGLEGAPSTRSGAPGARSPACTCASAAIPMHVMHNYVIPSRDALEFARLVERIEAEAL